MASRADETFPWHQRVKRTPSGRHLCLDFHPRPAGLFLPLAGTGGRRPEGTWQKLFAASDETENRAWESRDAPFSSAASFLTAFKCPPRQFGFDTGL